MDSMIAAELGNWLWKAFALNISFLELWNPELEIGGLLEFKGERWE